MSDNGTIALVKEESRKNKVRTLEGNILQVGPVMVMVALANGRHVPASYTQGQGVAVGKWCSLRRSSQGKLAIDSVSNTVQAGINPDGRRFELSPPANLSASSGLAGATLITWDVPPQRLLTYEVQESATGTPDDAVLIGTTSGGQFLAVRTADAYYRVRAVTEQFLRSSWSSWVQGQFVDVSPELQPGSNIDSIDFIDHDDANDIGVPPDLFIRISALDGEFVRITPAGDVLPLVGGGETGGAIGELPYVDLANWDDQSDVANPASGFGRLYILNQGIHRRKDNGDDEVVRLEGTEGFPRFGVPQLIGIVSGTVDASTCRNFILDPEAGSSDDLIEVQNLQEGSVFFLTPSSGSTITLKYNDGGATDKFKFRGGTDIVLVYPDTLALFKRANGVVTDAFV